jgi:hypothetical protein
MIHMLSKLVCTAISLLCAYSDAYPEVAENLASETLPTRNVPEHGVRLRVECQFVERGPKVCSPTLS